MKDIGYEKKLEKLGAFEISSSMLKIAKNNDKNNTILNAGRGNPNWINTQSRLAFVRLMQWGVEESKRTINYENMAGYTEKEGIYDRFCNYIINEDEVDEFIRKTIRYCVEELKLEKDDLIKELTDGIIGNNYPVPSRCLKNTEVILNDFLQSSLYRDVDLKNETLVFPVEGGTAAMCYILNSLQHNGLVNKGDKIAINTPIFTPYIQIPRLTGFSMVEINLRSKEENGWCIEPEQIDKLLDPEIKAFFIVNPSNPASQAISDEILERLKKIIEKRKDLIIVTDDVYGTFVDGFKTIYSVAPQNTILVYSFSKLYGVTGWRTGLIAMNKNNVCDRLIQELPEQKKKDLIYDYSIVTTEPEKMPFIDRMCADSRNIGLYHTSGLSTPQQIFMALMSLTHTVSKDNDRYIEKSKEIVSSRYHDLFKTLGLHENNSKNNAKYYSLINIYDIAEKVYDKKFSEWMKKNFEEIDFLTRLSSKNGAVLMGGVGFCAENGTVRVSQANLPDEDYKELAERILNILEGYHKEYMKINSEKNE